MADPLDPPSLASDTDPLAPYSGFLAEGFDNQASVLRKTLTPDGLGSASETWATVATLGCNLVRVSKWMEGARTGEVRAVSDWEAHLPLGSDVRPQDRLQIAGVTYEVTDTDTGLTDALVLRAGLRRLRV